MDCGWEGGGVGGCGGRVDSVYSPGVEAGLPQEAFIPPSPKVITVAKGDSEAHFHRNRVIPASRSVTCRRETERASSGPDVSERLSELEV